MALPLETQLGGKLPSSHTAPGPWLQGQHCQLGAGHQNPLEKSDRLGEGPGSDMEPFRVSSCSGPMPGLPLYSSVLVKYQGGREGMGRSMAHR